MKASYPDNPLTLDIALFRDQCPQFADSLVWSQPLIQSYWDFATSIVVDENYGMLADFYRQTSLNLLTAHLLVLKERTDKGQNTAFVTNSSVDKVSVTRLAPPSNSQFQWWLNQTPYGAQLLVMLEISSVGGISVGGLPERSAFRKVGGIF